VSAEWFHDRVAEALQASSALTKVDMKHMYCTHGCDFDKRAGIFIESSDVFKVLAVNGSSGDRPAIGRPVPHPSQGFAMPRQQPPGWFT
jgi:hypothetical protein